MNADERESISVHLRKSAAQHKLRTGVTANNHDVLKCIWTYGLAVGAPGVERECARCVVENLRRTQQIIPWIELQDVAGLRIRWCWCGCTRCHGDVDRQRVLYFQIQLDRTDRDRPPLEQERKTLLCDLHRQTLKRARRRVQKARPLRRELLTQAEHLHQPTLAFNTNKVIERGLQLLLSLCLELRTTFTRRVAQVQYDVRDRVVVERFEVLRHFDSPRADRALTFERQVALVTQVCFEHAAIILRPTRHDRLHRSGTVREPRIVSLATVLAV